jgi:LacI family transcriptional regulator
MVSVSRWMARPRKVSQTQIARDLGVSQALVSLALNGRKTGISVETYDRIWARAIALGYTPKGMRVDSAPNTRRRREIGYILRSPLRLYSQSNFFSHVQHGLHTTLEAVGCTALFLGAEDELDAGKLRQTFESRESLVGTVLLGEVGVRFLDRVRALTPRIVAVSAGFPGFCHSVNSNEQQAVELLVDHLVAQGHKEIGWLGGNLGLGRHTQRRNALKTALELRGLTARDEYWIDEASGDRIAGSNAVSNLFARRRDKHFPTALICYNGLVARGAVNTLHKLGLAVPDEISVVAVDHTRVLFEENPVLTGASAIPEKMGEAAARLILESLESDRGGFTDLVLPAELVLGTSSGPRPKAG